MRLTRVSFRTGDSLATADDATHQMTITRNGVVQTFPMSMGMNVRRPPRPRMAPTTCLRSSPRGHGLLDVRGPGSTRPKATVDVSDAVGSTTAKQLRTLQRAVVGGESGQAQRHPRLHQPQWLTRSGCRDNFGSGDLVVMRKNSVGTYNKNDGARDWQI